MVKYQKYSYLFENTILFTISSFGSKLLTFLLVPLYTRVLTTSEYGVADLIITSATLLVYVFSLNIADAVLRFSIENPSGKEKYLFYGLKILFLGTGLFGIVLLLFPKSQVHIWDDYCYLFLFAAFFLNAIYQLFSNYLRAINKVKIVAIGGIINTAVAILCNLICLLLFEWGLIGYLLSYVVGIFAASIYCLYNLGIQKISIFKDNISKEDAKSMFAYCVPLIFNGVSWWVNTSLDRYFITILISASANGIYAAANKIPTIMIVLQTIFSQAWNLSAMKEFDRRDKDGFFSETYNSYNAFMIVSCAALVVVNHVLSNLMTGNDFRSAWQYSSILLVAMYFSAIGSIAGSIFTAVKDTKYAAVSTVVGAIVNTVLNAVLIPIYGMYGAAIATAIGFMIIWIIRLYYSYKFIEWNVLSFKSLFCILLLILEVIIEHMGSQLVGFKISIFCIITILNWSYIQKTIKSLKSIILKKRM